jgi:hypothetical protein
MLDTIMGLRSIARPQIFNPFVTNSNSAEKSKVGHVGRRSLLTPDDFEVLARHGLPQHLKDAKWKVLYSLPRDGASFHVLLDKVHSVQKTVIAIKTERGIVLGGYAEEPWHNSASFFGTGNSFLYTIRNPADPRQQDESDSWGAPGATISVEESSGCGSDTTRDSNDETKAYEIIISGILGCAMDRPSGSSKLLSLHCCLGDQWCKPVSEQVLDDADATMSTSTPNAKVAKQVRIYDWTSNNRFFQFCNTASERIAFGGGRSSSFGLCIEKDFDQGSSERCDTFRNAPLAVDPVFQIVDM